MNPLTISVVIGSHAPPLWITRTLELLSQHASIEIKCIILHETPVPTQLAQVGQERKSLRVQLCDKIGNYVDRPRFPADQLEPTPLPNHSLHILSESSGAARIENSSPSSLPEETDVVLHLGHFHAPLPSNTPNAKHGIWFIKHDELKDHMEKTLLNRPALFWVHLWKWDSKDTLKTERVGSHALPLQSFSKTDLSTYGFGCLPEFIVSRLNWLAHGKDPAAFEAGQIAPELYSDDAFPNTHTTTRLSKSRYCLRTLNLFFLQTKERIRERVKNEQWLLGFSFNTSDVSELTVHGFEEIKTPNGMVWADPQLVVEDEKIHVFFEALQIDENKGRIAHAVLTPSGFEEPPTTVLDEPFHLSYPFIFRHGDEFYMIPETASHRTVSMYKADAFPNGWKHVGNIMEDVNLADTTVFWKDGLWWLFANGMSHESVDERDQLLLFFTEDVFSGNWTPHPLNPVVNGVDRARMAGPIYESNGELFRSSQYGGTRYGFGVNTAKITVLSTTDYQETMLNRLTPATNTPWIGCHTLVRTENVTVVDRLRRVRKHAK